MTCRVAFKPTSSILTPVESVTREGEATEVRTKGRHDPCVGIRAVPIAEAMLALVLIDHALRHRAQCGDVRVATPDAKGAAPAGKALPVVFEDDAILVVDKPAGKAVQKDAAAGKATFVSLLGVERARSQANALIDQAIAHLSGFGPEADLLRAIARFAVERDR